MSSGAPMLLHRHPLLLVRAANTTVNVTAELSATAQCLDINHCRTLQSIVYSCFSTVFLCTWSALHLNIPREHNAYTPFRRVWFMLGALLAPEVVIAFACTDWITGCALLKEILEHSPECGWTETHVQFAMMGGFRLKYADGKTKLMRKKKLFDYVKDGMIDLPDISEEEILERSKGDFIAKGITVIQTAWFVIQCLHRLSQNLPLAKLEVTTIGHALLNVFVYCFWWYKPLQVSCPVDVPPKKSLSEKSCQTVEGHAKEHNAFNGNNDIITQFLSPIEQDGYISDALNHVLSFMNDKDETVQVAPTPETDKVEKMAILLHPSASNNNNKKRFETGNLLADLNSSNGNSIADPTKEREIDLEAIKATPPRLSLYTRLGLTIFCLGPLPLLAISIIIGGSLGATHWLDWNLEFATYVEQSLWQLSTFVVTLMGVCIVLMAIFYSDIRSGRYFFLVALLHCSARISLLILALLQLRVLPYPAYVTPSWTKFYPHIG